MILGTAASRAEIRRLVALFDEHFFGDVTGAAAARADEEAAVPAQLARFARALREAMRLAHEHLDYIDWLIDNRPLAGGRADEPGRFRRGGADFGRRLSRRDRLVGARADARLVPRC